MLTPAQSKIATSTKRFRVANCGRRFGKSYLAAWELFGVAVAGKDRRVCYYAPTRDDARDIQWNELKRVCDRVIVDSNESRLELTIKTQDGGTSQIILYGWEAVQERGKGRGVKNHFIVLDEVAMYRNFWEGWQEVLRPTLTDTKGGALFISTPKGFNHFYDLSNARSKDPDAWDYFHYTSYDNPHIDPKEIDEARKQLTEDRFAQEYLADFRKQEGLVYKEFNRSRHVTEDEPHPDNVVEYLAGIDFGYTNPAAVIHIKRDRNEVFWVTGEWYETGRTDAQIADYVQQCGFSTVYPDPESPSAIKELHDRHINIREVVKNKDSIKNGIQRVRELLKQGKLKINHKCLALIAEFETYAYPESRDGKVHENPLKENDHALDALRYAIMSATPRLPNIQERLHNVHRARSINNSPRAL